MIAPSDVRHSTDPASNPGTEKTRRSGSRTLVSLLRNMPQPYRSSLVLAGAVFLGEASIMFVLNLLPLMPTWVHAVLDAFLITALLVPLINLLMLRPMVLQIAQREQAQAQLEQSNRALRASSEAEHHQRQIAEALTEAIAALNSSLDLDEVLDRILEQTHRIVPCRVMVILLLEGDWVHVPRVRSQEASHPLAKGFHIDSFPRLKLLAAASSPLLVRDTELEPDWTAIPGLEWVRSFVLAPLVGEGRAMGFLATLSDQPDFFPGETNQLLVTFAAYAAVALHHANLYRAELRARQMAETLSAASLALAQTLDLQTVLDLLLNYLHRLIWFDVGSVALLESESQAVVRARVRFGSSAEVESTIPPVLDLLEYPHFQGLLGSRQGVVANNRAEALLWLPDSAHAEEFSWLAVPLVAGQRVLGFCCLEKNMPNSFAPEHMRLTEAIVGQAAVAVQNAWLFQQVRAGRDRLQSLSHRLVEVQENERHHVARELHDEAGQMLASLMLRLKLLETESDDPAQVMAGVQELRQVVNTVQANLHRLAKDLRPASLDYLGLVPALRTFVNKVRDHDAVEAQFKVVGWSEERLPAEVEVSVYRVAQEALTNVVRHAKATHVDVLLQKDEQSIILTIEDDGIGFDPDATTGQLGLVGMRERCEMLGGNLVVESTPGRGTTLVAEIPYGDSSTDL